MSTIVIYTAGTLGDHLPFFALGQALKQRGQRVLLAVNRSMQSYAEKSGLETVALTNLEGGQEEAQQGAAAWDFWKPAVERASDIEPSEAVSDAFVCQCRDLALLCQQADLLVASTIRPQGYIAAQAVGLPWVSVSMNPSVFFQSPDAQERRKFWATRREEHQTFLGIIQHVYRQLGVSRPLPPFTMGWGWAPRLLLASSRQFIQPDLNQLLPQCQMLMTGFWYYQDPGWQAWQPDEALRRFCEPDDPQRRPLVLAFSSQPLEQPGQILALHARAAALLNRPLLVQRGWAGFTEADLPSEIDRSQVLFADFLPHDWLFARAACAIQHGGIGSIARALRQGCPLVVEPFGNDQLFNAVRVSELGAGVAMHPFRTTPEGLAKVLRQQVLTPECRQKAEALGEKLRLETGLETACQMLENCLEGHEFDARRIWQRPPLFERKFSLPESLTFPEPAENNIPRIIHQTWKDAQVPYQLAAFQRTWQANHPGWNYYFWTDVDLRTFLEKYYAWFLPVYDAYPEPIMRVDAARYFLLAHYGGLYVDLDFENLRPIEPLLEGQQLVLGQEPEAHWDFHFPIVRPFQHFVCNAFMASTPGHAFWQHVIERLLAASKIDDLMETTGPFFLSRAYTTYPGRNEIQLLPPEVIYPISAAESQRGLLNDPGERERAIQYAYAIHRWHCTWWQASKAVRLSRAGLKVSQAGQPRQITHLTSLQDILDKMNPPTGQPVVNCLMFVLANDCIARQAVQCFQKQTYPDRELLVFDLRGDNELESWIASLEDKQISYLRPDHENIESSTELQELPTQIWASALEKTGADYIAVWSASAMADPRRLAYQMNAILGLEVNACLLERQQIWSPENKWFARSPAGSWPATLVCERKQFASHIPTGINGWQEYGSRIDIAWLDFAELNTCLVENCEPVEALTGIELFKDEGYKIMTQKLQNALGLDLSSFTNPTAIPRIIHQTWKDMNVPPEMRVYQETWKTHHPDWAFYMWTDVDNREFIRKNYAWFLPVYDNYPEPIMRADAARYFILHHFGGVYVDLDFECLRPLDSLLDGKQLVFGVEPEAHLALHFARERSLLQIVCNAFMACIPGHPFWEHLFKQLVAYHLFPGPLDATGPFLLTRSVESYTDASVFSIQPAELLYPVSSQKPWSELTSEEQAQIHQTAFAIHHWFGNWWRENVRSEVQLVKATQLVKGQPVSIFWMPVDRYLAIQNLEPTPPLLSCLMVTHDRPQLAQRAVLCFQKQTYLNKELLILDDGDDKSLESWCAQLKDESVHFLRLLPEHRTLGELRNLAVTQAGGVYLAQWDDDDLSDPQRLEIQMAAIHALDVDACLLERHQIWWPQQQRLAISTSRMWESSFICRKDSLPLYPAECQGEDTPVVEQILAHNRIVVIDFPQLYTYVFHGANTFNAPHWEAHWRSATQSFEGDAYSIKLAELSQRLRLDLLHLPDAATTSPEKALLQISPAPAPQMQQSSADATAQIEVTDTLPTVLILTPVKDAADFLPRFLENLHSLSYPHARLSLAFLEGDSRDDTYTRIERALPALRKEYARVELYRRNYGFVLEGSRWEAGQQLKRRSIQARSRNYLLAQALQDEQWVLWVDVDVARWPADIIEQLLAAGKEIVVPNCLGLGTQAPFDMNTFKLQPGAEKLDWRPYIVDGILQPPPGFGRWYLNDLSLFDAVEVDGVGATMLLVHADLHREGLVFPTFSYKLHIETEGLVQMARDMGYRCWGLPKVVIYHPTGLAAL